MKTILIAHNYSKNSFATMSYHLAHELANLGCRVVFISYRPYFSEKQIIKKGKGSIIIYSWPTKNRPTSIKDFLWYSKIYLKYKPEIILGHFAAGNIVNVVSKILSFGKARTMVYYHTLISQIVMDKKRNTFKMILLRLRKRMFYHFFCDTVICPSIIAKEDLLQHFCINKGSVVLNPMSDRFRKSTIISKENIIISYLGRLDISKGVLDLIEAFKVYKGGNPSTKIILNIAGSGSEKADVIKMINDDSDINFFGELEYNQIDEYLSNGHFTIIPSKLDNLPTVGIESLMNRVPLLISNGTGLTEYLTDGEDCFKFEPNLNEVVITFERVENNFHLQKEMANIARITFEKKFTISNYFNAMIKLIEN